MNRRDFGRAIGAGTIASPFVQQRPCPDRRARSLRAVGHVKAVFTIRQLQLRAEGYYSWPGVASTRRAAKGILRQAGADGPGDEPSPRNRAEAAGRQGGCGALHCGGESGTADGLLLIPFKKSHAENLLPIIDGPDCLRSSSPDGVLLNRRCGASAPTRDRARELDGGRHGSAAGLRLIQTRRRMADSTIIDITGQNRSETRYRTWTRVQRVPLETSTSSMQRRAHARVEQRAARYTREACGSWSRTKRTCSSRRSAIPC